MKIISLIFAILTTLSVAAQTDREYIEMGTQKMDNADFKGAILDFDNAILQCKKGSTMDIKDIGTIYPVRAMAKEMCKDYKGAIQDYTTALELDHINPSEGLYDSRASCKSIIKDYKGAIDDFTKAIGLDPNFFEAYIGRSTAKSHMNNFEGAIEDLNKAITIKPGNAKAIQLLEQTIELKDMKNNLKNLVEVGVTGLVKKDSDLQQQIEYHNKLINEKLEKNDLHSAILEYNEIISLDPKNTKAFLNRGYLQSLLKNNEAALQDYSKAIELSPYDSEAYERRGILKYNLKEYKSAIEDYSKLISLTPKVGNGYLNRGLAKMASGDKAGACTDFKKGAELGSASAANAVKQYCQ